LVSYYRSKGALRSINGIADIDTVSREIDEVLIVSKRCDTESQV
jgi:hypothetical protein